MRSRLKASTLRALILSRALRWVIALSCVSRQAGADGQEQSAGYAAGLPLSAPLLSVGMSRGASAVGVDPAAPAAAAGPELQLRHRAQGRGQAALDTGLYAVLPMGAAALSAGYEWSATGGGSRRGVVGLAVGSGDTFSLGVSYHRLQVGSSARDRGSRAGTFAVGALTAPADWISLSVAVDAVNQPRLDGLRQARTLQLGLALRPWRGDPRLSLGTDVRVVGSMADPELVSRGLVVDVQILEGLHASVGYTDSTWAAAAGRGVWLGLSVDCAGIEARGAALSWRRGDAAVAQRRAFAVTARVAPVEQLVRRGGRVVHVPLRADLSPADAAMLQRQKVIPIATLKLALLADDPTVDHVIISLEDLEVGLGSVAELRRAIGRLREAGKQVTVELFEADEKTYMVAAAADEVRMDPFGRLRLDGFAVTVHYFADTLAKVGVRFESVEVGRYKSGADALTRNAARPEEADVQDAIVRQAHRALLRVLKEDRGLDEPQIAKIFARGLVPAAQAQELGLIDSLSHPMDPEQEPEPPVVAERFEATPRPSGRWGRAPTIAVVPVVGVIVVRDEDAVVGGAPAEALKIVAALDEARLDRAVAGVVLRIDSPGGDVVAAELIWRAVKRLSAVKPVVASMGDVAASGGYYVAAPTDAIIAEPGTITGSIGIFTLRPDLSGLLDMAAVGTQVYKSGERADWQSPTKGLSAEDRARVRAAMEVYYDAFVARVASGRKLAEARVRELAEGRVYTGEEAKTHGLVDRFGGLLEAVDEVRRRAGLAETAVTVDVPDRPLELEEMLGRLVAARADSAVGLARQLVDDLSHRLQRLDGRALALMPASYEVGP